MSGDYSEFQGKKVLVVRKLDKPNEKGESAVEVEGLAQSANELGILIKPKGKVQLELIPADEIEEVSYAPEKAKALKAKTLKPVEYGQARTHLLERHGVDLEWANAVTEQEAFDYHKSLDHEELKLGHVHGDKSASPASEAIAEAENEEEDAVA